MMTQQTLDLPRASSLTHQHLLAVINTRLAGIAADNRVINVCDIGCGNGVFLSYIATCLPRLWPHNVFIFNGFDVSDSGVQADGFFEQTIATLAKAHPDVPWRERLHLISSTEPWPFADNSLHIVTSNQVLEHVRDHGYFMSETHRALADGGVGINLYPLRHYIWEGHLLIPFVHKLRQHHLIRRYIKAMSYLGLGKYEEHRAAYGMTRDYFAEEHADFMTFMTNYKTAAETLDFCKAADLRPTFMHTAGYYTALVRRKLGRVPQYTYIEGSFLGSFLSYWLCRYIASITLTTEKRQIYSR